MPLYEYECTQCKRHTEKIQKFSDSEITQCPHCGGLLERVVSAPAISFKGGGWYADGYGNAKPSAGKNDSKNDSKNESKSDSGASSNSSAEPAASSSKDSTAAPASSGSSSPATPAAAAPSTSSGSDKD